MFDVLSSGAEDGRIVSLRGLITLSALDLVYADQYLYRAEMILPQLMTRDEYLDLRRSREALTRTAQDIQRAIAASDWSRVRNLAEGAAQHKARIAAKEVVLDLADAVYGPRVFRCDPAALSMSGVLDQPAATLESTRAVTIVHLDALAKTDAPWSVFYRSRASYFAHLHVIADEHHGVTIPGVEREKQLSAALEKSDFAEIKRLTDVIVNEGDRKAPGRIRAPAADDDRVQALTVPYPPPAVGRAGELGLVEQRVSAAPEVNAYLSCNCGQRPSFPEVPLSETNRVSSGCTCGHPCPPEVGAALRTSLDWLLVHPFMSSAGTRYLPWFGAETLLVETFPETEPDAPTPLLRALSLSSRRGLARVTIEDVVRSKGPPLCASFGLDPCEFVLACIPFDIYLRLAAHHAWGQERLWTHFDGYQVVHDPRVAALALVGGDVGYGGAADLCAVQRDYEAERITARFCVLRRKRFLARQSEAASSPTRQ